MKEMIKRVREEKGGFTLAELLIVVAIVLVLVAIAVPMFTGALSSADQSVGNANVRSVKAEAATQIMLDNVTYPSSAGPWEASATVTAGGDVTNFQITAKADPADTWTKNPDGSFAVTAKVTLDDVSPAQP